MCRQQYNATTSWDSAFPVSRERERKKGLSAQQAILEKIEEAISHAYAHIKLPLRCARVSFSLWKHWKWTVPIRNGRGSNQQQACFATDLRVNPLLRTWNRGRWTDHCKYLSVPILISNTKEILENWPLLLWGQKCPCLLSEMLQKVSFSLVDSMNQKWNKLYKYCTCW